jgi:hypothetical protein
VRVEVKVDQRHICIYEHTHAHMGLTFARCMHVVSLSALDHILVCMLKLCGSKEIIGLYVCSSGHESSLCSLNYLGLSLVQKYQMENFINK